MKYFLIFLLIASVCLLATAAPQQNTRRQPHTNPAFPFGVDTSDLRSQRLYAPFDGPVKGLPSGHGGGKFGAANCLLCG